MNPRPSGYEPEIRQVADQVKCPKRLAPTGLFVLVVSGCFPLLRILSRDGRAMESHLLNDLAVPLLSILR